MKKCHVICGYPKVSNNQAGLNKHAGMEKLRNFDKKAEWNIPSGLGKNLKMNKHADSITIFSIIAGNEDKNTLFK